MPAMKASLAMKSKRGYVALIFSSVILISYLHYNEVPGLRALRSIYRDLYPDVAPR